MDVTSAKILQIILNIESEAASRGILDQSALVKVFKPKDQNTIRKMYEDWGDIRLELIDALSNRNQTEIEAKLKQLTKMSKEYLQLATERFQYIMSEDAGKLA
jgi:predicted nucleic acid-binding protein